MFLSGLGGEATKRRKIMTCWWYQIAASCPFWTVSTMALSASRRRRGGCSSWHPGVRWEWLITFLLLNFLWLGFPFLKVVKVSHSTQTIQLVAPAVCQPGLEAPSTGISAPHQDTEERTPNIRSRQCLPRSYSKVMTPLQPGTSLVYLLCSPSTSSSTTAISPLPKRCRKKKRPLSLPGLKVTYKHFPLQFYEPSRHRILKKPPKGYLPHQGSTSSSLPPSCVRQLFRSLSPDLNADSHSFLPNKLSRDAAHADTARGQNRGTQSRSERGRSSRKVKTCLPASTRRLRSEALNTQGLRRSQRASSSGRSRKRRQR